ncbi:transmembrane protease serine 9-like [Limulus polyphemus]|uniref:Transmembrane protease serine 9-like n=1 Tax=Limulus polyphemus TaxID=6850 RepID=A0ABM1SGN0_LIMPO|nr:transmembrane protease serine 9-like [Limulus polyphemus]
MGKTLNLSRKPCEDATGEAGVCMFKWDCINENGVLLSTCTNGFLYLSCCKFPPSDITPTSVEDGITFDNQHYSTAQEVPAKNSTDVSVSVLNQKSVPLNLESTTFSLVTWTNFKEENSVSISSSLANNVKVKSTSPSLQLTKSSSIEAALTPTSMNAVSGPSELTSTTTSPSTNPVHLNSSVVQQLTDVIFHNNASFAVNNNTPDSTIVVDIGKTGSTVGDTFASTAISSTFIEDESSTGTGQNDGKTTTDNSTTNYVEDNLYVTTNYDIQETLDSSISSDVKNITISTKYPKVSSRPPQTTTKPPDEKVTSIQLPTSHLDSNKFPAAYIQHIVTQLEPTEHLTDASTKPNSEDETHLIDTSISGSDSEQTSLDLSMTPEQQPDKVFSDSNNPVTTVTESVITEKDPTSTVNLESMFSNSNAIFITPTPDSESLIPDKKPTTHSMVVSSFTTNFNNHLQNVTSPSDSEYDNFQVLTANEYLPSIGPAFDTFEPSLFMTTKSIVNIDGSTSTGPTVNTVTNSTAISVPSNSLITVIHKVANNNSLGTSFVETSSTTLLKTTAIISPASTNVNTGISTTVRATTTSITPTTLAPVTGTKHKWDYRKHCGVRSLRPYGRIVGGRNSYFGQWPWQVLVKEATWLGLFQKNKCGGVLLNSKYVITAAHCQPGFLASLLVVLGEHDVGGDLESLKPVVKNVKRMIVHRNYNAQSFENDLALLELETPVQFQPHIVPICLPENEEDFTGKTAFVSGWGKLFHGGPVPEVLQYVKVPIVRNSKCQQMFLKAGHIKAIRDNFICAGYETGGQDSCEGDSGGPLMVQRDDGRWVLVGTVSHGIKCADPNLPGVYMKTTAYKPWIEIQQFTRRGFIRDLVELYKRPLPIRQGIFSLDGCIGKGRCEFTLSCMMSGGQVGSSCGPLFTCCIYSSEEKINPEYYGLVRNDPYCGRNARRISRVVGGDDASFGQFPWQALIKVKGSRCGGALVGRRHVVTAGHCVAKSQHEPYKIEVNLGEYVLNSKIEGLPSEKFGVFEVRLHPRFQFTPQADRFDVAVLILDRPVPYRGNIRPICLPEKNADFLGQIGYVTGWGALEPGSKLRPKVLQHVPVPVINNQVCEIWHRRQGIQIRIHGEMMCAGYEFGGRDACQGDSGGPLSVNHFGVWYLIGVVSAGYSCAKQYQPGIYHRISSSSDWISANMV